MKSTAWDAASVALVLLLSAGPTSAVDDTGRRGRDILEAMAEANQPWLKRPPAVVANYAYDYHREGRDPQRYEVPEPSKAGRAVRQGASYYSLIHHAAANSGRVQVRTLEEADGIIRMSLGFDPPMKGHCGNGMQGSWHGYFNLGGDTGLLVLDAERLTPLRTVIGDVTERFGDFVELEPGRYVPLSIEIENGDDMRFDWTFAVHEPGLWLLDRGRYREQDVAWIDGVTVNDTSRAPVHRLAANAEREVRAEQGADALDVFLNANRHWLLPSLEARRGVVYDYRQEPPYRERVVFDRDGRILVELAASREHPDGVSRQRLWLPNGQSIDASAGEAYVRASDVPPVTFSVLERVVHHLAIGLRLDCALTRWAHLTNPGWAETIVDGPDPETYTLVLHWTKDARLFAGTMLSFTSWAYMHDVRYQRSEIRCDAETHCPLEEKDFAGEKLMGHFFFERYMDSPAGPVPGRIRAVIPHEKEDRDQALEMTAEFDLVGEDLWLLHTVRSAFRGGGGGSTGTVEVVRSTPADFAPVEELAGRHDHTVQTMTMVHDAPEGTVTTSLAVDETNALVFRPTWTEEARDARNPRRDDEAGAVPPLIGILEASLAARPEGGLILTLRGVGRCDWKAYRTRWAASCIDANGVRYEREVEVPVRSEGGPAEFMVEMDLPAMAMHGAGEPVELELWGRVEAMSGAYHGHGMWYTFTR